MSAIDIRNAEAGDRAAIEAIAAEVVTAGETVVHTTVPELMEYWFAPSARVFVAMVAGEIAGTYVVKPNNVGRGSHVANGGYMVGSAHRGLGVGRRLGEHSIEKARALGFRSIQFNFVVSTNPAVELWRRLGFEVVGTLPKAFDHRVLGLVDAYVMFRDL